MDIIKMNIWIALLTAIALSTPLAKAANYGTWNLSYLNDQPDRDDDGPNPDDDEKEEDDKKEETVEEIIVIGRSYPASISVPMSMLGSAPSGLLSSMGNQSNPSELSKQQCIDACLESFGNYYEVASLLSPLSTVGVVSTLATEFIDAFVEPAIRRQSIRERYYGDWHRGRRYLTAANTLRTFNALSLIGGITGVLSEQGMRAYCEYSKCSETQSSGKRFAQKRHRGR